MGADPGGVTVLVLLSALAVWLVAALPLVLPPAAPAVRRSAHDA